MWKTIGCLILSFGIVFGQIKNPSTGVDRTITRGDHSILTWRIKDNLENHEFLFVVKSSKEPSANRLIQKGNYSIYSGLTASYQNNVTTITDTIYAAETNNWQSGNYFYDIWDNTDSATIVSGLFTVNPDVGTPFDGINPDALSIYTVALDTPAANNNFIIGMDSTNKWYQKTLAQTKTILGIDTLSGNATADLDSLYTYWVNKHEAQTITGQKNYADTNRTIMTFTNPSQSPYGTFNITTHNFWVNTAPRPDNVIRLGWNIGTGGAPVVAGRGAMALEFESYFDGNGYGAYETHFAFTDSLGTLRRPISLNMRPDNGYSSVAFQFTEIGFNSPANVNYMQGDSDGWDYHYAFQHRFEANNTPTIGQTNGAGNATLSYPYFDNQNRFYLANAYIFRAGGEYLILDSTHIDMRNRYFLRSLDADSNLVNMVGYYDDELRIDTHDRDPIKLSGSNVYFTDDSTGELFDLAIPNLPFDSTGLEANRQYVDVQTGLIMMRLPENLITNGDFTNWTGDDPDGWTVDDEDVNNYIEESPAGQAHFVITDKTNPYLQVRQGVSEVGVVYGYQFNVKSVTGKSFMRVAGIIINPDSNITAKVYRGEVMATGAGDLFSFPRECTEPFEITLDNIRVWKKVGGNVASTFEYKTEFHPFLNMAVDDTIPFNYYDKATTIDSIRYDVDDSVTVQITHGVGGTEDTLFVSDTVLTGRGTISSFDDNTITAGSEVQLYITAIGDNTIKWWIKAYRRE